MTIFDELKARALGKINKAAHLLFETLTVMINGLFGHHASHIRPAGRIADHAGTAPQKCNGREQYAPCGVL